VDEEDMNKEDIRTFIIGVAGGTGSGKTTLVSRLVEYLGKINVSVIEHDSYYKDRSHLDIEARHSINYDHPDALESSLLCKHLDLLSSGQSVEVPIYDFKTHTRVQETKQVLPKRIIIVEGILIFSDQSLRDRMHIRIFVDTDDDIRFIRRIQRDINERGRTFESVVDQYLTSVKPMHQLFVEPSKSFADIIIPEGGFNQIAVDILATKIQQLTNGEATIPTIRLSPIKNLSGIGSDV
jgi:uridine kinase